MQIVTTLKEMASFKKAAVISLDIETNTTPPPDHPARDMHNFGLSYNADIIALALTDGETTGVLLDIDKYSVKQRKELREFLIAVLCRDVVIVGHNVLFDLRSIGGHFDFTLPTKTLVWDTQTMQRRLLLIPTEMSVQYSFGLVSVANTWGLYANEGIGYQAFVDYMKSQRGNLSELLDQAVSAAQDSDDAPSSIDIPDEEEKELPNKTVSKKVPPKQLKELLPDDPIWHYAGGFAGTSPTILKDKARTLVERYVAEDAVTALKIYRKQANYAAQLGALPTNKTISPFDGVNMNGWPELPGLVMEWTDLLRVNANLSIRGLPVDMKYLEQRKEETKQRALELAPVLLHETDSTDPYPQFKEIFSQLVWYSQCFDLIRENGHYSMPVKWKNWNHIPLAPEMIADAIVDVPREEAVQWSSWLLSLTPEMTRDQVKKSCKFQFTPPTLDLQRWMYQQCFRDDPLEIGMYKAKLKVRWWASYYRDMQIKDPIKHVAANHFKPYFVFCVAGWPLYDEQAFQYELSLGTKKFQERRNELERQHEVFSLQKLAIDMDAFSVNKKAMEWIFSFIEDKDGNLLEGLDESRREAAHKLRLYREMFDEWNTHKRMTEYWYHAQRDNKIHTLLVPSTTTGRDGSTLPNLQNIKMKKFRGVFVGPKDYTLVELDLSNAENNMGAMISGDDAFAYDVASADYHAAQMETYWPDEVKRLRALGDKDRLKELRSRGKSATFARPYGAGAKKIASLLQCSLADAKAIMQRLDLKYPKVAAKKKQQQDSAETRVRMGVLPAYTILWHKERVMIDRVRNHHGGVGIKAHTLWNYQQQGGVATVVHNAMVEIEKYLEANNYKSHMLLSVHDAVILALHHDEYHTDLVQQVCKIMSTQVPAAKMRETIPAVAFVTEMCPSNASKWGKRVGEDYPFPNNEYINAWGRWTLEEYPDPDDPKGGKAPTWKGDWSRGWTLEGMMEEQKKERQLKAQLDGQNYVTKTQEQKATALVPKDAHTIVPELASLLDRLFGGTQTVIDSPTKGPMESPLLDFDARYDLAVAAMKKGDTTLWNAMKQDALSLQLWFRDKLKEVDQLMDKFQ